jgi:hypothetical protein
MASTGNTNLPSLEDLLRMGINAAKAGNKDSARIFFQQVIATDGRNERAWLWLASVAEDPIERRRFLQTVLEINPTNNNAQKLLAAMDNQIASTERSSMMIGLRLLGLVLVILVVVGVLVFLLTR